ncbi:hypothetical protein HDV05_008041 [Chytridiales sp. JEL 0842]|nr:hypothetical protein HDV05_008041 [Chytridiales sp. JEL 0842]
MARRPQTNTYTLDDVFVDPVFASPPKTNISAAVHAERKNVTFQSYERHYQDVSEDNEEDLETSLLIDTPSLLQPPTPLTFQPASTDTFNDGPSSVLDKVESDISQIITESLKENIEPRVLNQMDGQNVSSTFNSGASFMDSSKLPTSAGKTESPTKGPEAVDHKVIKTGILGYDGPLDKTFDYIPASSIGVDTRKQQQRIEPPLLMENLSLGASPSRPVPIPTSIRSNPSIPPGVAGSTFSNLKPPLVSSVTTAYSQSTQPPSHHVSTYTTSKNASANANSALTVPKLPTESQQTIQNNNVSFASTCNSSSSNAPTDLSDIISSFVEMDLHSEEAAFKNWLAKKKQRQGSFQSGRSTPARQASRDVSLRASPVPPQPSGHSRSMSPAVFATAKKEAEPVRKVPLSTHLKPTDLTSLTPPQLNSILSKRAKAEKAFKAWLLKKEEEEWDRLEAERIKNEAIQQKNLEEARKRAEKERRAQEAVDRWNEEKKRAEEERKEKQRRKEEEEREAERRRREMGEQAFREWKKRHQETVVEPDVPFYVHKNRWVDVSVPPTRKTSTTTRKATKKSEEPPLLSPPHLYASRDLYTRLTPTYILKYPLQVPSASATADSKKKVVEVKMNTKAKAMKQFNVQVKMTKAAEGRRRVKKVEVKDSTRGGKPKWVDSTKEKSVSVLNAGMSKKAGKMDPVTGE